MAKTTANKPFPMFDADPLIAAQQRNIDAFTSASQIVADGAKAFALRQSEILQGNVDQWVSAGNQFWGVKPGEFKPADQVEKAKTAYETALSQGRELAEIAMKAQSEALGVVSKAMMANLDDMKSLAKVA